jgi:hypothetical protein
MRITMDRKKELHEFGKTVALERLEENGYECSEATVPCFDLEAKKDGLKYIIAVRARNHTTDKNKEKTDTYNLFNPDSVVKQAAEIAQERGARAMWVTVRVNTERKVYDAYHGFVNELKSQKQIPMSPNDRFRHKKLTQREVPDQRIKQEWSNVK